jgi:hypothetical protein
MPSQSLRAPEVIARNPRSFGPETGHYSQEVMHGGPATLVGPPSQSPVRHVVLTEHALLTLRDTR